MQQPESIKTLEGNTATEAREATQTVESVPATTETENSGPQNEDSPKGAASNASRSPNSKVAENPSASSSAAKLAPAPLPQENPWGNFKRTDSAKPPTVATEVPLLTPKVAAAVAAAANKQAGQRKEEAKDATKARPAGKEKWVPYTPVVLTTPVGSGNNNNSRQKQKTRAKSQNKRTSSSNYHHNGSRDGQSNHSRSGHSSAANSSGNSKDNKSDTSDSERPASSNSQGGNSNQHGKGGDSTGHRGPSPSAKGSHQQFKSNNSSNDRTSSGGDHSEQRHHREPRKKRDSEKVAHHNMMPQPMFNPMAAFPNPYETAVGMLKQQLEYYFSIENLCKDMYLRSQMNSQGLVPIDLLAGFNRIRKLSDDNAELVMTAFSRSELFEIVGSKVRCRFDWERWVLPAASRTGAGKDEDEEPVQPNTAEKAPVADPVA